MSILECCLAAAVIGIVLSLAVLWCGYFFLGAAISAQCIAKRDDTVGNLFILTFSMLMGLIGAFAAGGFTWSVLGSMMSVFD